MMFTEHFKSQTLYIAIQKTFDAATQLTQL